MNNHNHNSQTNTNPFLNQTPHMYKQMNQGDGNLLQQPNPMYQMQQPSLQQNNLQDGNKFMQTVQKNSLVLPINPFFQPPDNSFMEKQKSLKQLKSQIELKNSEIQGLEQEKKTLSEQNRKLQELSNQQNTEQCNLEYQIQQLEKDIQSFERQQFLQENKKQIEIRELDENIKQTSNILSGLNSEIQTLNQKKHLVQLQLRQTVSQAQEEYQKVSQQLNQELSRLQYEKQELDSKLKSVSSQFQDQQKNTANYSNQLTELDEEFKKVQNEISEDEEKKRTLQQNIRYRDQTINDLRLRKTQTEKKSKKIIEEIEQTKLEISRQQNYLKNKSNLLSQYENWAQEYNLQVPREYESLRQQDQQLIRSQQNNSYESRKQEKINSKILLNQQKQMQAQQLEKQRTAQAQQLKSLQMKFQQSHGLIEICFLVDCTGSMDPYKKQAELCVEKSMIEVKNLTQRDTLWSLICYQDKAELRKLGAYQQFGFSDQSKEVQRFLQNVKCDGGGDVPEDIDGAIRQMINKLNWKTQFKIAMLICDAPCHGIKFNNLPRAKDEYPDDDLTNAIELMIQNDIFFIGIIFNSSTIKMFEEIKKIYERNSKKEYFYLTDLRHVKEVNIFDQLVTVLTQVSQTATQTNVRSTKVSKAGKVDIENNTIGTKEPMSPIEALCKKNLQMGLLENECVNESFRVFRVEFSDQKFNEKYKQIKTIGVNDFNVIEEGQWQCLRTKAPFAQGAMKQAYLMTKKNQNTAKRKEFYVCKTPINSKPYNNQQSALQECVLHLIAQKWMKKFNRDLDEAIQRKNITKKYPQVGYSDILIFQDRENHFWIAERFFEGEFVKYNNNFGFLSREKNDLNKIGNSFSVYTFIKSELQYLICDIQGVDCCFTDPAVCTMNNHKLDQTDMGQEGIARFQVGFNGVKHICQEILSILDINI